MKTLWLILILVLIGCKCGCAQAPPKEKEKGIEEYIKLIGNARIYEFEHESHKYLIANKIYSDGGVSIIHSESCSCKKVK